MSASTAPVVAADQRPLDVALMERARHGDVAAFGELYDRHAPMVLALMRRILAREAHDLLHDVFIEAWQSAREYDATRASVRVWLLVRARARAIDRLRRQRRERNVRVLLPTRRAHDPIDEHQLAVRQALSKLEPSVRETLELTYFEGLTAREISDRTGAPEGTVRSRLARGLSHLHEALA
ncbi:MAG TPA: sigma-70 family RNA polymerase sigma factor [Polyangiales bacterium]|nr:sigma-70 family RNA polymerase sigma factor [Polyangiales bacterium]